MRMCRDQYSTLSFRHQGKILYSNGVPYNNTNHLARNKLFSYFFFSRKNKVARFLQVSRLSSLIMKIGFAMALYTNVYLATRN